LRHRSTFVRVPLQAIYHHGFLDNVEINSVAKYTENFDPYIGLLPVWHTVSALDSFTPISLVNYNLSTQLSATSTTSYTLSSGTLPTGTTLSSGGLVSGTYTSGTNTFVFTVTATNSQGSADRTFTQTINAPIVAPVTWMDGTSLVGGVWTNKGSGGASNNSINNANLTTSTQTAGQNGVTKSFPMVVGGTNSRFEIDFPGDNYTFVHISRYNGSLKDRIWNGELNNWLSGHLGGFARVYHGGWIIDQGTNSYDNWSVTMDQLTFARINRGAFSGTYLSALGPGSKIGINVSGHVNFDPSDWACAEFILFDQVLTAAQYTAVEDYLCDKYGTTF